MTINKQMPIWEHLEDLRWTIFKIIFVLFLTTVGGFFIVDKFMEIIQYPLTQLNVSNITLIYEGPLDAFLIKLKLSLLGGLILGAPFTGGFIWSFVCPGMKKTEKKLFLGVCIAGTICFLTGVSFGYFMLLKALPILTSFASDGVENIWNLKKYIGFAFKLLIGIGIMFELPVVLFLLVKTGMITQLTLRKIRPYAYIVVFFIAAVVTPPDPFTQLLAGIPLIFLYELGLFAAGFCNSDGEDSDE